MNDQSQMLNRSYLAWPPDPTKFQARFNFSSTNPNPNNWSSKSSDYFNEIRRNDPLGISKVYKNPNPSELYPPNRSKPRKFYPKKKFNPRFAPYAPRNTTSFLIRAKKSGGITSLVSPYPVTPAVLPTPIFSPSREDLVDTAKEEWGVNGYGTMNGLIRLRSLGHEAEEEEEGGGGTSDSDVEERVEVERRLDHDLSRFEMIYPNDGGEMGNNKMENRVDEQDRYIGRVEEENLTLKERLFLMERELEDMRRRVLVLEMHRRRGRENGEEEVVSENGSDNEGGGDVYSGRSGGGGDE